MTHILKFLGALFALSLLARFVPFGCLVGSAVLLAGLWKLTE